MRKMLSVLLLVAGLLLVSTGAALAHDRGGGGGGSDPSTNPGTKGEPNCFGMRTSHAASAHDLNPNAKAAEIQWWIDNTDFFDELLVPHYGDTVEVGEVQAWVRAQCE